MSMIISYFYFRVYKFASAISFGLRYPHYRAALIGSLIIFFNVMSILSFLNISHLSKENLFIYGIGYLLFYCLCIRYFLNTKRYRLVMKMHPDEGYLKSILGNLVVFVVLIGSFVLYIKSRT